MTDAVQAHLVRLSALMIEIGQRLHAEVDKLGFEPGSVALRSAEDASWRLSRDPYSGDESLLGEWRDAKGHLLGELKFHADGSFYVEQDVLAPHPRRRAWFVEAVSAWGRAGLIKGEARLLPLPD